MERNPLRQTLLLAALFLPLLLAAALDVPGPAGLSKAPEATEAPKAPEATEAPEAPGAYNSSGGPDSINTPDRPQPAIRAAQLTGKELDSIMQAGRSFEVRVPDRCYAILDVNMPRSLVGGERRLFRVSSHPGLDSLFTEAEMRQIRAEIDARCDSLGKDSLLTSELFWAMRPYLDRLHYEDPHYRILIPTIADPEVYTRRDLQRFERTLPTPGFSLLQINDTLVVDRSLDPAFRRGDQVTAINGVPAAEYLKYGYDDRYTYPITLMGRCFYSQVVDRFRIELRRDGRPMVIETPGMPNARTLFLLTRAEELDRSIRTWPEAGCGYIAIPEFFPNNNRLIRILHRTLRDFRRQGLTDVILDLRRNTGGNGHNFDRLLSIFIDKPVVEYCTGQWVKASRRSMPYYNFLTEEMLGQTVPLPEGEFVRSFPTIPAMHVDGLRFYVLVGRDTGSIAASFVNMLQYHGAALLAGEPLRHNALKYGEVVDGGLLLPTNLYQGAVSMVRIDERTRAVDGVVQPDIPIPCIAAEYLSGRDGQLDRLLAIIRERNGR